MWLIWCIGSPTATFQYDHGHYLNQQVLQSCSCLYFLTGPLEASLALAVALYFAAFAKGLQHSFSRMLSNGTLMMPGKTAHGKFQNLEVILSDCCSSKCILSFTVNTSPFGRKSGTIGLFYAYA